MIILGIPIWLLGASVRVVFIVIGWFFIPLTLIADGGDRTAPMWRGVYGNVEDIPTKAKRNRWTKYVEMAWRNPTGGTWWRVSRPSIDWPSNPDAKVRNEGYLQASRWISEGIFWEYWHMRQMDWVFRGKHYRWFEFRIGWKFVESKSYLTMTFQLGPRSS